MTTATYELTTAPDGSTILRCLLCRTESLDAESVQRLHCAHCSWFHEPLDEDQLDLLRHIQTAAGEVQMALEIAQNRPDDSARVDQLKTALRELRRALSRA